LQAIVIELLSVVLGPWPCFAISSKR